jgi:hypothetical protein
LPLEAVSTRAYISTTSAVARMGKEVETHIATTVFVAGAVTAAAVRPLGTDVAATAAVLIIGSSNLNTLDAAADITEALGRRGTNALPALCLCGFKGVGTNRGADCPSVEIGQA